MARTVTMQVSGLRELGDRLKMLSEDMSQKIARQATAAGAAVFREAAKAKVPVDTGNLKKNIIIKRRPKGETSLTSQHIVTVRQGKRTEKQKAEGIQDAFYGRFVEFGTVKMSPRPFLRPAFDENQSKAIDAVKDRLETALKKAGV